MKRIAALILVIACLTGYAAADVITIDTETASVEELQATIEYLQSVVKSKKGETEPEMYTFSNGMSVGVVKAVKNGNVVKVTYLFSHQEDSPKDFSWSIVDKVFQNGIQLDKEWTMEDYTSASRSVLRDTVIEASWSYAIVDDSPITVFLNPMLSFTNEQYSVTVDIE